MFSELLPYHPMHLPQVIYSNIICFLQQLWGRIENKT